MEKRWARAVAEFSFYRIPGQEVLRSFSWHYVSILQFVRFSCREWFGCVPESYQESCSLRGLEVKEQGWGSMRYVQRSHCSLVVGAWMFSLRMLVNLLTIQKLGAGRSIPSMMS